MKKHTIISKEFNITKKDVKIIDDIIVTYSGTRYLEARRMLIKIFGPEITAEHYVVLGILIGEHAAAVKYSAEIKTTLSICHRQN